MSKMCLWECENKDGIFYAKGSVSAILKAVSGHVKIQIKKEKFTFLCTICEKNVSKFKEYSVEYSSIIDKCTYQQLKY